MSLTPLRLYASARCDFTEADLIREAIRQYLAEAGFAGGRIEIENFLVLETQTIVRGEQRGTLTSGEAPRIIRRVSLRLSKKLKSILNREN